MPLALPAFLLMKSDAREWTVKHQGTLPIPVQLSPSPSSMAAMLQLIFLAIFLAPSTFAQQRNPVIARETDRARGARMFTLSTELQSRVQALESAKRAGDPTVITTASRSVLALALREMGEIELMQASASAAIQPYRRSIDFEDALATRIDLALAYLQALRLDEALSTVTDVLVADPENARAWYVQGKAWMAKERSDNAVTSFSRVLSLQEDPAASYLLGAAFLQLKEREKAEEVFRRLSGSGRRRTGMHLQLADAYRAANYINEFSREVRQAGPGAKAKPLTSSPMASVMALAQRSASARTGPMRADRLASKVC